MSIKKDIFAPLASGLGATRRAAMLLVMMLTMAQTAWAWDGSGTQVDPYQIKTTGDLDQLATDVNAGTTYEGTYFKVMNDIAYSYSSDWNDTESTENNYTAIGGMQNSFKGHFDGAEHTVSGIRIYKRETGSGDNYQGLFRYVGSGAEVKNIILADIRITGYIYTGGIVGINVGSVTNCHVANNVMVRSVQSNSYAYGGIAGGNEGAVTNCTSAVTISATSAAIDYLGAITGHNQGTLTGNLAVGATIPRANNKTHGAICGDNLNGTLQRNYYIDCTLAGKISGIGCHDADVTKDDGAVLADIVFSRVGDTYIIREADGWNVFCNLLAGNAKGYFSGKTIKLINDITVTRMAASSLHGFTGTFDGHQHTLTVSYGSASEPVSDNNVAPFRNVESGCVIENLHVAGDIYTSAKNAAGLAGSQYGDVTIQNCRSSVTIHSSVENANNDGTHGGFIALFGGQHKHLSFEGCVFDGKLLTTNGTSHCGGFVGWANEVSNSTDTEVTFTNCLYAPAAIADGEEEVGSSESATFARKNSSNTVTLTFINCYYTRALGDAQGKAYHSVTAGENVTIDAIALTGDATEYTVSGITAYSGGGLKRGDVKYYSSGDQVSLTLSHGDKAGYAFNEYTASAGTLSGTENPYTLTMPDADVTISVGLSVIDWATESDGDADHPYMIYNKDQLDLLAHRVNGTHGETRQEDGYSGKYFKLANDINYPHSSDWNNFTSDENNFEAIGGNFDGSNRNFRGHFDGNNKTISGIRIYKGGNGIADDYQGIFGWTYKGVDIHDLTLADARITGHNDIGGIVGYSSSTVNRCHVAANVAICAVQPTVSSHGGIVGVNDRGTIENCISAATLTVVDANNSNYYGGIVGTNRQYSTLHDNLAIGATVPAVTANNYGAITGYNNKSTLQRNYYIACKVADVENATGVGSCNADVTGGTVPGYLLTLGEGITSTALSFTIPEHKELDGSGQLVTVAAVTYNVAAAGTTVWFNSGETEGYSTSYIVDGSPVSGNSITMPAAPVTVTSNDNEHIDLWGIDGDADGSSEHPYIITTTAGWFHLAGNVAAGKSYSDKYFQLGAGISISTMVGTSDHPFSGHFNGNGNTLDIDIISVGEYTAPFRYVSGATITGLHTTGTVTTSHKCATGLVGRHDGDVTISDCRSSVTIASSIYDDGTHGGFAATGSGTVTIEGCLFDGVICCNIATLTNKCGGFVGWRSGTVNISNSLYAPAAVPEGKYAIKTDKNDGCATFARNGADITNCYYTQTLGDAQGKACHSITAGENVTIDGLGAGTEYSVSGITAYPTGIKYNDVYYAGSGDQVSLTLSHGDKAGYAFNEYTASAGTLSGTENPYTLTMPDQDVTVSPALRSTHVAVPVSYVDADGTKQTHDAIALDGTENSLGAGWYFVGLPTVAFDHTLHLYGDVNLILADGCTMNVTGSDESGIAVSVSLTIYGQTDDTGTLNATGDGYGIYTGSGTITISGGRVTATGGFGDGIYTVNGTITISGGRVTATGGDGISTYKGTITLGLRNATDYIYASSFYTNDGNINIKAGQTLTDGTSTYSGSLGQTLSGRTLYLYTEHLDLTANLANDNYWTTFYCGHTGFKIDEGENAWAYTAEYDAGNARLTLHKLGKVIPKGTAVILVGDDNSISMTASSEAAQNTVANDLHGTDIRTATSELGTGTFYVMGKQSGNFGFFPYTAQYMPARKAYLLVDGGAQARGLTMALDETTGISSTTNDTNDNAWYTLDGRKLDGKPTTKGLYINNGRKIVIK